MNSNAAAEFDRRSLLKSIAGTIALAAFSPSPMVRAESTQEEEASNSVADDKIRELLKAFVFAKKDVDDLLSGQNFNYISREYDPLLGYVFCNCHFRNGMDGSICTYTYEPSSFEASGARLMIANADKQCRVNPYGDSFTHGDQVSDGETWQEQLAAHLGEPIRNFGVGNYSVYQAYLRMQREEIHNPAKYLIVTIYDDDHRRSLQPLMPGWGIRPYLRVDANKGVCEEHANPCPTPHSLYQLCDLAWLYENFKDYVRIDLEKYSAAGNEPRKQADRFKQFYYGLTPATNSNMPALVRDALSSSIYLVDKIEAFASSTARKVIYVMAYGTVRLRETLVSGQRFDQSFVDFLRRKELPFVDLLDLHAKDYAMFKIGIDDYLKRYYVNGEGHYSPVGNAFMAIAIKEKLLALLNPKPSGYFASGPKAHASVFVARTM